MLLMTGRKMMMQTGFTLIELVIVLVIIGLLAAVAGPKFVDLQTTAKTNVSRNVKGAINSAMSVAFASHRLLNLSASGATPGTNEYISTCTTLTPYLDGAALPSGTTCAGSTLTFPDTTTSVITAESNTARATAP